MTTWWKHHTRQESENFKKNGWTNGGATHGTEEIEDVSDPKIDLKTGKVVTKSKDDRYWEEHISTLIAKKIYGRQKENVKQIKSTVDNNRLGYKGI